MNSNIVIQRTIVVFTFALNKKKRGIQNAEEEELLLGAREYFGYEFFRFLKYRYRNAVISVCG